MDELLAGDVNCTTGAVLSMLMVAVALEEFPARSVAVEVNF